jgi:hypothetical protein
MYVRRVFVEPTKRMKVIRFIKKYPYIPYHVVATIFGFHDKTYIRYIAKKAGLPPRKGGRIAGFSPWKGHHDVHVQADGTVLVRIPGVGSWDMARGVKVRTAKETPKLMTRKTHDKQGNPLYRSKRWQTPQSLPQQQEQDQAEQPQAETQAEPAE